MNLKTDFFSKKECEVIHNMSIKILQEVGVIFEDDYAISVFEKAGAEVSGNLVKFSKELIEDSIKKCPSEFTLHGRNGKKVVLGGNNQVIAPESGAIMVHNKEGVYQGKKDDYEKFQKLHHQSKIMDMLNPNLIEPSDVSQEVMKKYQMATCLKLSDKPTLGINSSKDEAFSCIKTVQKLYGFEENVVMGVILGTSPNRYSQKALEVMRVYVENKQPVMVSAFSQPGATSPVSIFGTLALDNSGILAGIVYAQLLRSGAPVVYSSTTASCDLRYVSSAIGAPETAIFTFGVSALSKFYNIPSRTLGAMSDSKEIDWQSGVESTMTLLPALMSSSNFIFHSCGVMDSFNILSYSKFILDEHNISMFRFLVKGINVELKEEDLEEEFENIKEVGAGGQFLESDHTMEYFRDHLYTSDIFNKMSYNSYVDSKVSTMEEKAYDIIEKRLEAYEYPVLTKEEEEVLRNYVGELFDLI